MKSMIARILLVASVSMLLSACNTFRGLGQDIQKGGQAIESASERRARP